MTTFPVLPNHTGHFLVASPSSAVRDRLVASLLPGSRRIEQASGGAEALGHLENGLWQVLFLDRRLPDLDAEELSQIVRHRYPDVEVVLLDNGGDAPSSALASPTVDLPKQLARAENNADEKDDNQRECEKSVSEGITKVHAPLPGCREVVLPGMIGASASMLPVYRMAHLVARRDTTVLITGPTGTGKELVARALHQLSPRVSHTLAVVNCAAIPETLLEAELFGYSRGAFTGALQSYAGRIQAAHLGTLFLDEIGDMPLNLQPKLLRFLEQKELQRIGSSQVVRVDARVISATNVDLLKLVREGKFREDLYYRLSTFPLEIPALRERVEDVARLGEYFLEKFCAGGETPRFSNEAMARLRAHDWPGNVRELQNVIERAVILAGDQPVIRPAHLMLPVSGMTSPSQVR